MKKYKLSSEMELRVYAPEESTYVFGLFSSLSGSGKNYKSIDEMSMGFEKIGTPLPHAEAEEILKGILAD